MNDFAIVCPSRSRPDSCRRMVDSALMSSEADVLIYVERDDPSPFQIDVADGKLRTHILKGPRCYRGEAIEILIAGRPQYQSYLVVSDDVVFERTCWDREVRDAMNAFGDDIGVVHLEADDHVDYVNWACVSRKWIDTLGWFNAPGLRWFCQDTVIQSLGVALGRITQIHPQVLTHNVERDYDVDERIRYDSEKFLWYMAKDFPSDLAKLRATMAP